MSEDNMKDLSNDNCGDGCGCGHDHEEHHHDTITLTMENNEQVECAVLGIFEVEDQEYVALLPEDSEDVFIYIYKEDEEGEIELANIESQEDFDRISAAFLEIMESEEEEEEEV
ncbi:DUF1292 domain-containing protein [Petrocella sp. FN5]|uniref:DUF1292 domain-containing protein n=1 Tax=Petrocella sp. FN5 TaxID=3032002 RepID=UPI0023DC208A|nr:DUF1292 domain-containing protein [Petrocella sp. FN5]MDF1618466.1 DUF1292 domain-containing protein [Petrocella sp. FN5]